MILKSTITEKFFIRFLQFQIINMQPIFKLTNLKNNSNFLLHPNMSKTLVCTLYILQNCLHFWHSSNILSHSISYLVPRLNMRWFHYNYQSSEAGGETSNNRVSNKFQVLEFNTIFKFKVFRQAEHHNKFSLIIVKIAKASICKVESFPILVG